MLARASVPYLVVTGGLTLLAYWGWRQTSVQLFLGVAVLSFALFLFLGYFFRDPNRDIRVDANLVFSPADGTVRKIHQGPKTQTVEIFLAIWNVHVQRAPVAGKVLSVKATPGLYLMAFDNQAGKRNTRCETWFKAARGSVGVTQVAGAIARKVECWVKPGDRIGQGEYMGIIHLGSQVRVELPKTVRLLVKPGDRVAGGLTPIARWR